VDASDSLMLDGERSSAVQTQYSQRMSVATLKTKPYNPVEELEAARIKRVDLNKLS
jgi:hypothetical protein